MTSTLVRYLEKNVLYNRLIGAHPHHELANIVVIPCYKEQELFYTLNCLLKCDPCQLAVEVIVVLNYSVAESKSVKHETDLLYSECIAWAEKNDEERLKFHFVKAYDLPQKHAGVGMARKIGMDEAVRRFEQVENPQGVITCFDADSLCEPNYLVSIENWFVENKNAPGASIYFEHPLEGSNYDESVYNAITNYELYLRYYRKSLKMVGHPHAYHTIGSAMAVRAINYCEQGGMNRRKAGEDFYFLMKFIPLNGFGEINSTRVIPSPRVSDRVPFGTGKAVGDLLHSKLYKVYHPKCFEIVKKIVDAGMQQSNINRFDLMALGIDESVAKYLESRGYFLNIELINKESKNHKQFKTRYFNWFNLFETLKLIHFLKDEVYHDVILDDAVRDQFRYTESNAKELLLKLRQKDRTELFLKEKPHKQKLMRFLREN